jgi:hypothetical protein
MTTQAMTSALPLKPQRTAVTLIGLARIVLMAIFALALIAALHPDVRSEARGLFVRDYRTIVSTAKADLLGNGSHFTIVKVKTRETLSLEVYEFGADGSSRLLEKIALPDAKDGYFNFNGQSTNLAVDDINGDGRPEILAPSFDQNLVGRLNVYQFNSESKKLERIIR